MELKRQVFGLHFTEDRLVFFNRKAMNICPLGSLYGTVVRVVSRNQISVYLSNTIICVFSGEWVTESSTVGGVENRGYVN